jgi:sugar lactone lactonase YvrE
MLELVTKDIPFPNGIALSPEDKKLYVGNSRPEKYWMVYDIKTEGGIASGRKFADVTNEPGPGSPDGMKVPLHIWSGVAITLGSWRAIVCAWVAAPDFATLDR